MRECCHGWAPPFLLVAEEGTFGAVGVSVAVAVRPAAGLPHPGEAFLGWQ